MTEITSQVGAGQFGGLSVAVTGGSGFIGTHLLDALIRQGATVVNLDTRLPKKRSHTPYWQACNLLDEESVIAILKRASPSLVVNLAAITDISKGPAALAVNTQGLANVMGAIDGMPQPCHLVHASTQLVMRPGHRPEHPLDFSPYTDYGQSKVAAELLLHKAAIRGAWTIVRPTNVWGPFHPTFASQIWRYIQRRLYIHPSKHDPIRSYGYVENVVFQMLRISTSSTRLVDRRTYYVGDEPIRSSIWLDAFSMALTGKPVRRAPYGAMKALALAGQMSKRLGGPAPLDKGRLYRMTTDYAAPMSESIREIGLGPITLDEGVGRTVSWLQSPQGGGA